MIISKSISKLIGASLCVASLLASCNTPTTEQTNATVAVDTSKIVIENIMARRSIRQYKPQPVNRDTMQIILNCGINAPNGQNKQSWAIRVVDNPEFINGITEVFKEKNPAAKKSPSFKNMFRNAPTVVFIANARPRRYVPYRTRNIGRSMKSPSRKKNCHRSAIRT